MSQLSNRAYAAFEVKSVGDGRRTFKGWATTPTLDRVGDTINPLGVRYANPLSLLHGHKHDLPIGTANFKTPTKKGVEFDAEIPQVEDGYGSLRDRVDTAWGELKYGLVRAVSIGFRPVKWVYRDDGGTDYQEIEVFELSIVAIPALPEAVITAIKSGRGLSRDMVRGIRLCDPIARAKGGPVLLPPRIKTAEPALPGRAVRLLKP